MWQQFGCPKLWRIKMKTKSFKNLIFAVVAIIMLLVTTAMSTPKNVGAFFMREDISLCESGAGWVDVRVLVILPENDIAKLETSWYVVHPSDLNPGDKDDFHYETQEVRNGDIVTLRAWWPGIQLNDEVVETHFGATIHYNGEIITGKGFDYYWYPWVCEIVVTDPTAIPTLTTAPIPTSTTTPYEMNTNIQLLPETGEDMKERGLEFIALIFLGIILLVVGYFKSK